MSNVCQPHDAWLGQSWWHWVGTPVQTMKDGKWVDDYIYTIEHWQSLSGGWTTDETLPDGRKKIVSPEEAGQRGWKYDSVVRGTLSDRYRPI